MKTLNKLCSLLLVLLLLIPLAAPAAAAAEENAVISIRSAEDLLELSHQCSLDSWSRNKTVLLECDIDLSSVEFQPIPTFGGTFDGQGHTISGFKLQGSGDVRGLFRYIQETGVIRNLTVEGEILPSEQKNSIGGIVGHNCGTITHCTFRGTVKGKNSVGGLVGINKASGQIIHCSFSGSVTAEHYVGGIAGQNLGSIVQCENSGEINTTEVKASVSLNDLNLGQLTSTENSPAATDIGGIAGFSSGVIQSCRNLGNVGYPHVGYNVGGIAGRQTGYLDSCINEGTVHGRKDVGGIAGQMEPQLTLKYDETTLNKIWGELDTLESLINTLLNDASGSAHSFTDQIQAVSDSAGTVKDAVADLSEAFTGWADGSIDQINDASARISWVLERIDPILDTVELAVDQMETAAGQLSDGLSQTSTAAEIGADAAEEMSLAMADIKAAIGDARAAFEHVSQSVGNVKLGLGDSTTASEALDELTGGLSDVSAAFSAMADSLHRIRLAMDEVYEWVSEDPYWQLLESGVDDLLLAMEDIAAAFGAIGTAIESIANDEGLETGLELLRTAVNDLLTGMEHLGSAYYDLTTALELFQDNILPKLISYTRIGLQQMSSAGGKLSSAIDEISAVSGAITGNEDLKQAMEQLTLAVEDLETGMGSMSQAETHLNAALEALDAAASGEPEQLTAALEQLRMAAPYLRQASAALLSGSEHLSESLYALNKGNKAFEEAQTHLQNALDDLSDAADLSSSAASWISSAVGLLESEQMKEVSGYLDSGLESMDKAVSALLSSVDNLQAAIDTIDTSDTSTLFIEDLKAGGSDLNDGILAVSRALDLINAALDGLEASSVPEDAAEALRQEAKLLDQYLRDAGAAVVRITTALEALEGNLDLTAFETALTDLENAIDDLDLAAEDLQLAANHMETAMGLIEDAADHLAGALDTFSLTGTSLETSFSLLEQAVADVDTLLEELIQKPVIQFEPLEDSLAGKGEALNASADGFLNSVSALNSALRAESDVLTDDLKNINEQIGNIVDLIHQVQQEQAEIENEGPLEDVSGEDVDDSRSTGKISGCTNRGAVDGDVNVAGVAGSLAIEYDFDPEDDLTISGSRTLESRYLVKAVVRNCVNHGAITAKKDQAGGIVGTMDFGRVIACQGYGSVTSTGGSYVGGIAGVSYGGIQDCWAMCRLGGSSYVGGIAGLGTLITDCRSLIELEHSGVGLGTIAGQVEEGAQLSGNLFVHHILAGVDGVSYAGAAEPVSYEEFCTLEGLPPAFTQFELTFVADGSTVLVVPFQYGDSLTQLPDIPEKSGYSAQWPEIDYGFLSFSQTLEAEYTAYATALSDGSALPKYLVSGSFSPAAQVIVTEDKATWSNADGTYTGTAYTVKVDDPSILGADYTLHWRLDDDTDDYTLWVFNGTAWAQQPLRTDGSYLMLELPVDGITFCLLPQTGMSVLLLLLVLIAILAVIIAVIVIIRIVRKSRRKKTAAVVDSGE